MRCQKCQFWCEDQDAFCRKCGAPFADEAVFQEQLDTIKVEGEVVPTITYALDATEATTLTVTTPAPRSLEVPTAKNNLKSKVLGLANRAVSTEEGRALVKGAAVLAVSVGLELLNRSRQNPNTLKPSAIIAPEGLDKLAELVEPLGPLAPGTTIVETWAYRYSYTRRVTRRVR